MFTLPKLLRPIFSRHPAWLGELCRIPQGLPSVVAARLLTSAYATAAPGAQPSLVLFVQTFGDLANFNPQRVGREDARLALLRWVSSAQPGEGWGLRGPDEACRLHDLLDTEYASTRVALLAAAKAVR